MIDDEKFPIDENTIEIVDEVESKKLKKMLGLRLIQEGIEYFEDEKVEKLIENGLLEKLTIRKKIATKEKKIESKVKNNENFSDKIVENTYEMRLRLTQRGMLLANDVFVEFI